MSRDVSMQQPKFRTSLASLCAYPWICVVLRAVCSIGKEHLAISARTYVRRVAIGVRVEDVGRGRDVYMSIPHR